MATINPSQDYDAIHTLTFAKASGTCKIRLYRGSSSAYSGTVYYRAGTSGSWTQLDVSGTDTTFSVTSTTMQIGHSWNKSGDNYMTPSFYGQSTNLTNISISQKAVLSGSVGDYFMGYYANSCTSLTSLDVPDTSSVTSVGSNFMVSYAGGCVELTSLDVPDTSSVTSVGNYFMGYYAYGCTNLTSLSVPDTSSVTSVGSSFMGYYAYECTKLTSLILPAVGWFANHDVNWSVPSGRLNYLKGYVTDSSDLTDWQDLTTSTSPNTLYINYIRSASNVVNAPVTVNNSRSAKITGKSTSNSNRSAKVTGGIVSNDARGAKIKGRKYSYHTKGYESALPTDEADLATQYTDQEETDVSTNDGTRVDIGGSDYLIHHHAKMGATTSGISVTWDGQSTLAPSSSTVYLQIYNFNTNSWETLSSNNSASANTDFSLTGSKTTNLTYYYDSDNYCYVRVYQEAV